jgi:hypothetical protein
LRSKNSSRAFLQERSSAAAALSLNGLSRPKLQAESANGTNAVRRARLARTRRRRSGTASAKSTRQNSTSGGFWSEASAARRTAATGRPSCLATRLRTTRAQEYTSGCGQETNHAAGDERSSAGKSQRRGDPSPENSPPRSRATRSRTAFVSGSAFCSLAPRAWRTDLTGRQASG